MNKQQAHELAQKELDKQPKGPENIEVVFLEQETKTEDFGWIFFYQSKRFVETGNALYALGGGGPILVDKETSEVIQLGSRLPSSDYITLYRKYRDNLPMFFSACNSYNHGDPI